ncbi:MAG: hypothetical protein ACT4OO_14080 [Nitrospiraceae bacterium]
METVVKSRYRARIAVRCTAMLANGAETGEALDLSVPGYLVETHRLLRSNPVELELLFLAQI